MRHISYAFLVLLALSFALSCQSNPSPVEPGPESPAGESLLPSSDAQDTGRYLWGYYHCMADFENGTVTALPARTSSLHINVVQPLNSSLGIGFTVEPGSDPQNGFFVINVSITHPFPGNPKLTGFDVRGILLTSGSLNANGFIIAGAGDPQLVNSDGWSRWWNPTEFTDPGLLGYVEGRYAKHDPASSPPTATLNAYKAFGDALWATADFDFLKSLSLTDPGGRAVFGSGRTNSRQYQIQFAINGGPQVYFDYAIDASWAAPNPNPPQQIPGDFPMWANGMEPFQVEATVTECTLAGTPYGGDGAGNLVLSIDVWDWQGWSNGNYEGQIGDVRLYSPDVDFDPPVVERADGIHNTVLTVTATGKPSVIGTVPVVIEIPAAGTSWKQGTPAAPSGEIAAYARLSVEILLMDCQGDDNVTCDDAVPIGLNSAIQGSVCMPHDPSDHYVFTIPAGAVMNGTIELDNFDYGDNDLILYDGCPGDPIDMAMNPYGVTEVLEVANLESGFFYIAVLPGETAGSDVQPYKLTLDIAQSGSECTTDSNNEYTSATLIGLDATDSDSVCAGGDLRDWYRINVPAEKVAGGSVYVNNGGVGNIDVRVYETYPGPATFWSSNTGTQDELVNIDGLGPGQHYIELIAIGGTPEGDRPFTLDVSLVSSNYNCTNNDGNDSHITADPIGFTDVVSGTICFPADPDWFILIVPDGSAVHGTITLSGDMIADNDLYIYEDPTADPIDYSAQAGIGDEEVSIEQFGTGTYYIKASAHPTVGGGDQPYTLTTDLEEESVGDFDFLIHAHIITSSDGSNAATSEARVQRDVAWADEFYSRWGGSFTLAAISYINRTSWLAASSNEIYSCHLLYKDKSGPINVYYVNSFPDMSGAAAYCRMDCRYAYQTHNSTYVAMSDYAVDRVLAHELGHATGIFHDVYLLDMGFSSCYQINQYYCPYGGANGSFCRESDATYGNLMWFSIAGWDDPEDYWLSEYHWQSPSKPIESQVENWTYFHLNYKNNF